MGNRIKSPRKNDIERESVGTRVLNPNASEASYKPKQCSNRKNKLKNNVLFIFFGGFWLGGFYPGIVIMRNKNIYYCTNKMQGILVILFQCNFLVFREDFRANRGRYDYCYSNI